LFFTFKVILFRNGFINSRKYSHEKRSFAVVGEEKGRGGGVEGKGDVSMGDGVLEGWEGRF
jgi:hypothetical protein